MMKCFQMDSDADAACSVAFSDNAFALPLLPSLWLPAPAADDDATKSFSLA
jgi:hypothetical protein